MSDATSLLYDLEGFEVVSVAEADDGPRRPASGLGDVDLRRASCAHPLRSLAWRSRDRSNLPQWFAFRGLAAG